MNVLLIQPPHEYEGKDRDQVFFPIGLGYIARVLLDEGHYVEVLDLHAVRMPLDQVLDVIRNNSFDVLGISAMSTQYNYVRRLAGAIKEIDNSIKIILGWVLSTYSYESILEHTEVDICVIGEGEVTIKELLKNLDNYKSIDGIAFKKDGVVIKNKDRQYIQDLDTLPLPPYHLFPMEIYINNLNVIGAGEKLRTINISIGRGCPYNCNFCSKSFSGFRLRSVDSVIKEIEYLKDNYAIEGMAFADECLVIRRDRVLELCEKISAMRVVWNCQGRVNLVDEKLLCKMKSAGCTAIGYGIESGSQKILNAMNKKITTDQAKSAILATRKAGLYPVIQMMFGYPGEDEETIRETIRFFQEIDHPGCEFSPTTPLPGSALWLYSLDTGFIKGEKEFLEKLEGGYMPDAPVLVNYTDFSTAQLRTIRENMERRIRRNYIRRHPLHTLREYANRLLFNLRTYGTVTTLNKILGKLGRRPRIAAEQ